MTSVLPMEDTDTVFPKCDPDFRYAKDHTSDFLGDELMGTFYLYTTGYEHKLSKMIDEKTIEYDWKVHLDENNNYIFDNRIEVK